MEEKKVEVRLFQVTYAISRKDGLVDYTKRREAYVLGSDPEDAVDALCRILQRKYNSKSYDCAVIDYQELETVNAGLSTEEALKEVTPI